MVILYNSEHNEFIICSNFTPNAIPDGYKVISEKKFKELQEEHEKASKEE